MSLPSFIVLTFDRVDVFLSDYILSQHLLPWKVFVSESRKLFFFINKQYNFSPFFSNVYLRGQITNHKQHIAVNSKGRKHHTFRIEPPFFVLFTPKVSVHITQHPIPLSLYPVAINPLWWWSKQNLVSTTTRLLSQVCHQPSVLALVRSLYMVQISCIGIMGNRNGSTISILRKYQ